MTHRDLIISLDPPIVHVCAVGPLDVTGPVVRVLEGAAARAHINQQRIEDLVQLAANVGRPLALPPAKILALEDANCVVDPFTGACTPATPRHITPLGVLFAVGLLSDGFQPAKGDQNQADKEQTP